MKVTALGAATAQYATAGSCGARPGKTWAPRSQPIRTTMTRTLQCAPIRMAATRPSGMVCFIDPAALHGHAAARLTPGREPACLPASFRLTGGGGAVGHMEVVPTAWPW